MTSRHVIAGLRGAVTVLRRAVAANQEDIARGHDFHHYLVENQFKLAVAELKLQKELEK